VTMRLKLRAQTTKSHEENENANKDNSVNIIQKNQRL
jgi:hypothetical protein